jgi:hypothetical protein
MVTTDGTLLERAAKLQAEVAWVQEYHDRWIRIGRLMKAQLVMCHENKKGDPHAIDALNTTLTLAETKAEKCAAWLLEKKPELTAINREVFIDE